MHGAGPEAEAEAKRILEELRTLRKETAAAVATRSSLRGRAR